LTVPFQVLQTVWVRAVGIPPGARSEFDVMELAKLVGDPEEVHLPSLQWKSVWVKVSCKDPIKIGGTSEVFINKQERRISWYYSDKLEKFPPNKPGDDLGGDDDEVTDEEDPKSQESHGWLETGKSPPRGIDTQVPGSSSYQGKKTAKGSIRDCEQSDSNQKEQVNTSECIMPDIVQENQALATKVNSSVSGMTSNQEVELSKLGFFSTDDIYHTPDTNVEVLEMANPRTKNLNEQAEEDVQILEVKKNSQPVKEVNAHKEKPEDNGEGNGEEGNCFYS